MVDSQWYRYWSLAIKNDSWVENTSSQVDFIIAAMGLKGTEKILDLACGYGRHALELARRGYDVTGVDITPEFIEDAKKTAAEEGLKAEFILSDIRDVQFGERFDVVLNLADGAIGYLENEVENNRIFDIISQSLKPGGKHLMDICNAEHAEQFFPKRWWEVGQKSVSLPMFDWDPHERRMLFGDWSIHFDEIARRPEHIEYQSSIRLYALAELTDIIKARGMQIIQSFGDYDLNTPSDAKHLQLLVYSQKAPSF